MSCGVLSGPPSVEGTKIATRAETAYNVCISSEVPPPVLQILVNVWCIQRMGSQLYGLSNTCQYPRLTGPRGSSAKFVRLRLSFVDMHVNDTPFRLSCFLSS